MRVTLVPRYYTVRVYYSRPAIVFRGGMGMNKLIKRARDNIYDDPRYLRY